MGLLSKFFGSPKPRRESVPIPDGATSRDVIAIAIRSVVEQTLGNCATLEPAPDGKKWVQLTDFSINCSYPHDESPEALFPGLCNHPIVAGFEDFVPGVYMLVSLKSMDPDGIRDWIERYFLEMHSIDLSVSSLNLQMQEL